MNKIRKDEWGAICDCQYIGVEFKDKREDFGEIYETKGNLKVTIIKLAKDQYIFYDPLQTYMLKSMCNKKIHSSIHEMLLGAEAPLRVFDFDTALELNEWLIK